MPLNYQVPQVVFTFGEIPNVLQVILQLIVELVLYHFEIRVCMHLFNTCKNIAHFTFRKLVGFPVLFDLLNNSIELGSVSNAVDTFNVIEIVIILINSLHP